MLNTILGSFSTGVAPVTTSYESIATVTLSSTASTVTFSSIPQTYTHLQLRSFNAQASATQGARLFANGDTTTTNYWLHALNGNGTSASAAGTNNNYGFYYSGSTSGYLASIIDILDYTNTNKRKVFRALEGYDLNGSGNVTLWSMGWTTSAITSLQFDSIGSSFQSGSVYALYGIKGS